MLASQGGTLYNLLRFLGSVHIDEAHGHGRRPGPPDEARFTPVCPGDKTYTDWFGVSRGSPAQGAIKFWWKLMSLGN